MHYIFEGQTYSTFENAKAAMLDKLGGESIVSIDENPKGYSLYRTPTSVYSIEVEKTAYERFEEFFWARAKKKKKYARTVAVVGKRPGKHRHHPTRCYAGR